MHRCFLTRIQVPETQLAVLRSTHHAHERGLIDDIRSRTRIVTMIHVTYTQSSSIRLIETEGFKPLHVRTMRVWASNRLSVGDVLERSFSAPSRNAGEGVWMFHRRCVSSMVLTNK